MTGLRFSLRAKFTGAMTLVATLAVMLTTASFLVFETRNSREAMLRELRTVAQVLAQSSAAPIAFGDRAAGEAALAALLAKPDIIRGAIASADEPGFAVYERDAPQAAVVETVSISEPVLLDGERIGAVRLTASLGRLEADRRTLIVIALAISAAAIGVALLLATVLRHVMLRPILHLANVMNRVSDEKNYARRAERLADDELGDLIDGFNSMVGQIEQQHRELTSYREHLESLVDDRTRELEASNRELQRALQDTADAKTRAEAASQAKSEFLANMSHELRTPLNAILGFSEMIRDQTVGPVSQPRYVEYAQDIHHSGAHLLAVISDILDVARIEMGRLDLHEELVDLRDIVESALRFVRPGAERKGLDLVFPGDGGPLPRIHADPVRLKQVLINLLSNSVKFTDAGGTIRVAVEAGRSIRIRVTDTGIGIAEEDLDKVLMPFGQVESPFSRRHQGTGLGLSLSKMLIERHDGTLSLQSRPGAGTTVTIELPAHRAEPQQPGTAGGDRREA